MHQRPTISRSSVNNSRRYHDSVSAGYNRHRYQSAASHQSSSYYHESHRQPIALASHTLSVIFVPARISSANIYDYLLALSSRNKPRCFEVYRGLPFYLSVPEFARIKHIFHFFNLISDLNLPIEKASYTIIPSQYSSRSMVIESVIGAPIITAIFHYTVLVNKLLLLNDLLCDDRVFRNILAIQIDFREHHELKLTVIFNDFNGSYTRNQDFFTNSFAHFMEL